jgi:hypothetical protein
MKRITLFVPLLLASILGACASSLVYDPSLQLSHSPPAEGDVDAGVGLAYLLETRPDTGRPGDMGATFLLRGAFSEKVTLGIKHWVTFASFGQNKPYRSGL